MTNLTRVTGKTFGETATATGDDPQIGQFGSAKAGTYVGTTDVATIQNLPAWSNGFVDSVTPNTQFPPLPEVTGAMKVLSYQENYLLQKGIPEWDSGTTYYTNDFCKMGNKIYYSLQDNNTNQNPTTATTYWQEFSSGASRNIGEIVQSTIPLTDAGLHLLDGTLLSGDGSYAQFVDYIADLYDSGDYTAIFDTEANWQSSVTTYGVCGKFVYDSVNNTVRLPKITGFIEGASGTATLGDLVEAGSPNIIGGLNNVTFDTYSTSNISGAFDSITNVSDATGGSSSNERHCNVTFSASASNSIYGNSNTVQPQAIKVLYYIVVATSTKTAIQVDIDEIATDLNGKADVDLTNVNTSGTSRGASWAMPSSTYDTLTLGASGTTYTAPANGWFYISKVAGGSGKYIRLGYSPTLISIQSHAAASSDWLEIYLPVKKGDIAEITYSATGTTNSFCFVYAEGSESEA